MRTEKREIWTEEQREAYRLAHPLEERLAAREAYWDAQFDLEAARLHDQVKVILKNLQPA